MESRTRRPAIVSPLLLLALAIPSWAQQAPTGSWSAEASGAYFYEGAGATDGTYLYLVGGYQYGTNPQSGFDWAVCRRYDPVNNSWITIAEMPYWHNWHNAAAYYDGRVFSLGHGDWPGRIYAYSIATNTWATLTATLTNNRYYAAAATLGDKIYIAGGYSNGASALCDEFDPATDTITPRAPMPGALVHHCMAAVESLGKAYVMGGWSYFGGGYNGAPLDVCYEFTPPTVANPNGTWAAKTPMNIGGVSAPRSLQPSAFALNNRVYVAGGHTGSYGGNGVPLVTLLEYNPNTDAWAQRASKSAYHFQGAGVAINGKGYVYGGTDAPTANEEFTPPDFGAAPEAPTAVTQTGSRDESALQAQADAGQFDGWTNGQITFSADVSDPDAGQLVRLRVRVKPAGSESWTMLDSGLRAQGTISIPWSIPAAGAYDWEYRVEDDLDNCYPPVYGTWAPAFSNANSPDFRSDQSPPTPPVAVWPSNADIEGVASFSWTPSTDDGPATAISYEIQSAHDGGFNDIEAQFFSAPGTTDTIAQLTPSDFPKYWRLRARDIGGNFSAWSSPLTFRLVQGGGSGGGGGCGNSVAGNSVGVTAALFIGLAILSLAGRRRG